jgi:hypothetical protein
MVAMERQIAAAVDGSGVKAIADFENIATGTVYKMLDQAEAAEFSYSRVARLTEHFGVSAAAEHLAMLAGGTFLPVPQADDARFSELTGAALEHLAQASREIIEAHSPKSDGGATFTPREARHLLAPLGSLLSDVSNLIALARSVAEAEESK